MNILIVANKVPYPPNDGGAFATLNMALGLQKAGANVTVAAISTPKHPTTSNDVPLDIAESVRFETVFVDTRISPFKAVTNFLFSKLPYNAERFISKDFEKLLEKILIEQDFDLIQLEGLYLAPYIPCIRRRSKSPIALRAHNVECEIWERTASNEPNSLRRFYLKSLAKRIRRMEIDTLQKTDLLVPISLRDEKILQGMGFAKPSHTCPTGYQLGDPYVAKDELLYPSVFHIGGLDWGPNREGLMWFLENCWELIREVVPGVDFYVAGRNASKEFVNKLNSYPKLNYLGEVPDSKEFMASKAVMVVPLLAGSGMRIKIVEGLSLGKAIVSTSIGAEGIEAKDGEEIMIANTPNEFVGKTVKLLQNKEACASMGEKAKLFASQKLDNDRLVKDLYEFYLSVNKNVTIQR